MAGGREVGSEATLEVEGKKDWIPDQVRNDKICKVISVKVHWRVDSLLEPLSTFELQR
jgi:hypothetical protein